MTSEMLPRHEHSRRHYREQRYARHLSQQELDARIRDIVANLFVLTPDVKYGPRSLKGENGVWMEKFIHVIEEMALRHGPYPSGFSRAIFQTDPLPDFTTDLAKNAAKQLSHLGLKKGEILIKFGKRRHMEGLYEAGELRLQPATYFAQPDHNGAVRDDELVRAISVALSRDDIVKVVRNPQDVPPDAPEQRVDLQIMSPTDYWLYCVTKSVEARLFVDFQADSCVVIRDPNAFMELLRSATEKALPDARMCGGPALYLDPLLPASANMFVPSIKHFKYSYQEEHRFCWLPASPAWKLDSIDLTLGNLKDISLLITL